VRSQNWTSTERSVGSIPQRRVAIDPAAVPIVPPVRSVPRLTRVTAIGFLRLPSAGDPSPTPGRIGAMCCWAAGLGLAGVLLAIRALAAILGEVPEWYEPVVVTAGAAGIALTVAAFLAVHRRRLPWALLTAATTALLANLILILSAP
jgi:hypothetical protein